MEAGKSKLLDIIQGDKQYIIPIYQRRYSWKLNQCKQILDDIIKVASNDNLSSHFIGSIVYISEGEYRASGINHLLLIDGQQRMTTVSILLLAVYNYIKDTNIKTLFIPDKIFNQYLVNQYAKGEEYIKLILNKDDKKVYEALLKRSYIDDDVISNIKNNYDYFYNQLKKLNIDTVFNGINKLMLVWISLEKDKENAQLIFESINSTGLALTQSDLIRNYILMDLDMDFQRYIYEKYWYSIEKKLGDNLLENKKQDLITLFIRDYLTIKLGEIPNIDKVYDKFKEFFILKDINKNDKEKFEKVAKEIYDYAILYYKIRFSNSGDKDIDETLESINNLEVSVAYPFILEAFKLLEEKYISKNNLIEVLKTIESYVFRRAVCGLPTNSLNKVFLKLLKKINKEDFVDFFKFSLFTPKDKTRFPNDEEFFSEFKTRDMYNFQKKQYMFEKLEHYDNKEIIYIDKNLSFEHIMPQKLSNEWKNDLGYNWKQIYDKYLHTIGNITLTGYNSTYKNKRFIEKLNIPKGFKESNLKLNSKIKLLNHWGESEIIQRSENLGKEALSIWRYEDNDSNIFNKFKKENDEEEYLEEDLVEYGNESTRELYEMLREFILSIDDSIYIEPTQLYVAYKHLNKNICDVIIQKRQLKLDINMKKGTLSEKFLRDISNIGSLGNGDYEYIVKNEEDIPKIIKVIKKSYKSKL